MVDRSEREGMAKEPKGKKARKKARAKLEHSSPGDLIDQLDSSFSLRTDAAHVIETVPMMDQGDRERSL